MDDLLVNELANNSPFLATRRLQGRVNTQKLFRAIDADSNIAGAGVVYIDADNHIYRLREFRPVLRTKPIRLVLRETPRHTSPDQFTREFRQSASQSAVLSEALAMTLACTGAVLSWVVMLSGTVAVPFTGGASALVVGLAAAGTVASSVQCGVGIGRTFFEFYDPEFNEMLDEQSWYEQVTFILDMASLGSIAASGTTTLKLLLTRQELTGKGLLSATKRMTRQQRRRITQEFLMNQKPGMTLSALRKAQADKLMPKRFTPTQITHATQVQLLDSLAATLGVLTNETAKMMASKTANVAVGVFEELDH